MSQHFGNKIGGLTKLREEIDECKKKTPPCTQIQLRSLNLRLKGVVKYIYGEMVQLLLVVLNKKQLDGSDKKEYLDDLRAILTYLQYRQTINKSEKLSRIVRLTEKKIKELEQLPDLVISHRNKMPLGGGGFMKCFGRGCSSKPSSPGAAAGPSPSAQVKKSNSSSSGNLGGLGAVSGKRSSPHASTDSAKGKKSSRKSSSHGFTAYKKVLNEARDAAVQLGLDDVVNQADEFITEAELKEALKGALPDAEELTEEDNKYLDGLWEEIKNSKHPAKSVNVGGGRRRSGRGRSMRKRHTKRPTQKMRVTMRRVRRARNRRGGQACAKF